MGEQNIVKSVTGGGSGISVAIRGVLGIEQAAGLHRALSDALAEASRVVLDARELEDLDLSILQVLCSACKTAASRKRCFVVEDGIPDCMKTLNNGIGAHMVLPCRQNNNEPCICFGGAH